MDLVKSINDVAAVIAADVKKLEEGLMAAATHLDPVESKVAELSADYTHLASAVTGLADEVHSVIDDAADTSNGNTWSIDKIKAYIGEKIAIEVAANVAGMQVALASTAAPAEPVNPAPDFVAVYTAAKTSAE